MFSQVTQQIKMYGKIEEWASCPLNAKRGSPRLPKSPNLQLLFEMRFVRFIVFTISFVVLMYWYLFRELTLISSLYYFVRSSYVLLYLYWWQVGKILLNALLYPGIKTNLQKNSLVTIFHTSVRKWKLAPLSEYLHANTETMFYIGKHRNNTA